MVDDLFTCCFLRLPFGPRFHMCMVLTYYNCLYGRFDLQKTSDPVYLNQINHILALYHSVLFHGSLFNVHFMFLSLFLSGIHLYVSLDIFQKTKRHLNDLLKLLDVILNLSSLSRLQTV